MSHTYVVLDIETTGLEPATDIILEVAAIHIDLATLESKDTFQGLAHFSRAGGSRVKIDDVVQEMHTENGLWAACDDATLDPYELLENLAEWFVERTNEKIILCGNSVQFDHAFLTHQSHSLKELLHYRCVDVRTLILAADHWSPASVDVAALGGPSHRAMSDCEYSLACMREFKGLLK
jgi:oligoribonuclease